MGNFFSYCFLLLLPTGVFAQLTCNAGPDKNICQGTSVTLGGSPAASGGVAPYTYSWSPSTYLGSATIANPGATVLYSTTYTLTVKDGRDSVATDIVKVNVDDFWILNAGPDKDICLNDNQSVTLGGDWNGGPYTFAWTPTVTLNNPGAPKPVATPTTTTTYTLHMTSTNCGSKTDMVTISVHGLSMSAGQDTTILEGQSITLHASPFDSSYVYFWQNFDGQALNYQNTWNPDVAPKDTTIYYLTIKDPYGCTYYDNVLVRVTPNDDLYFYNSITPNGDGENDNWVIGNLEKYPKNHLQIFNRYGQEIYSVTDYHNDWNGKYLGQNLPGGTYYYLFDTKTEKGKFKGSITIFR